MSRRSFGYIRKLPSGLHQASYTKPNGTRANAPYTFLTRADASAWLSIEQVKLRSGSWVDPTVTKEHLGTRRVPLKVLCLFENFSEYFVLWNGGITEFIQQEN